MFLRGGWHPPPCARHTMAKVIVCKCELTLMHPLHDFYDSVCLWVCLCTRVCCKIWLLTQFQIDEHSSFHTLTRRHMHPFHSLAEWRGSAVKETPTLSLHLEDMKFLTFFFFLRCVRVWIWYCVCMIWRLCASVSVWFWICVCCTEIEGGAICVCVCVLIHNMCVCDCVCLCVCAHTHTHAWLSGLSQTAQNSLQSDISPAGDKWWLDEREHWGLARISVSLRRRHIYTHTHLHTRRKHTHAHTHTLIHWQNTADTQNYQTRGWTLSDGQANLLIVQSCTCVLVCVSVHAGACMHIFV